MINIKSSIIFILLFTTFQTSQSVPLHKQLKSSLQDSEENSNYNVKENGIRIKRGGGTYYGTWHGGSDDAGDHAIEGLINELLSTVPLFLNELFGGYRHGLTSNANEYHADGAMNKPGGFIGKLVNGIVSNIIDL